MESITFFPGKTKKGGDAMFGTYQGKLVICLDTVENGNTVILTASEDKTVFFAKVKEHGINAKVEMA